MDDALFQNARQLGLTDSQARKLSDQYLDVPGEIMTEVASEWLPDALGTFAASAEGAADKASELGRRLIESQEEPTDPEA